MIRLDWSEIYTYQNITINHSDFSMIRFLIAWMALWLIAAWILAGPRGVDRA